MKVIVPMAEVVKEDSQESKKKSVFTKLKEKAGDSEEHLAILSNFVRLGVLIWVAESHFELCDHSDWPAKSIQLSLPASLQAF